MATRKRTRTSKPTALMKVLHALPPTGARGFENLCALLLTKLTGARFLGARSGQQNGRDLDSARTGGWFVVVECKRYGASTKLSERELLAEITIAHRNEPTLDMWVLAATRGVDANTLQALYQHALGSGLDLQVLPCGTAQLPENMDFLCAAFAADVLSYCKPTPNDSVALRAYLASVKRRSDFKLRMEALRGSFDQAHAGLPTFRTKINAALTEQLRTEAASRARLGNALAPGEATPLDVPRANASKGFVEFLGGAGDPAKPRICAVVGDEGNGKSWAAASWIRSLLAHPQGPAVFWFKAADVGEQTGLAELARKGASLLDTGSAELLRLKLRRWFKRSGQPFCVVVLDGINERRDVAFWAQYILGLSVESNSRMLVVLTARPDTWRDLKTRVRLAASEISVGEFDRDEFALALHDKQRSTVERLWQLGEVARKPRYLADALAYLKEGGSAQELTVERLYYESWSNRVRRRPDYPLGQGDFEGLLRRLARESEGRLDTVDVLAGFATLEDPKPVLRELGTSGVLRVGADGQTQLSRRFLVEGLSLLLLDVLSGAAGAVQDLRAQVGTFVHDTQQQPLTAQICAAAAYKSLLDPSIRDDVTTALLLELLDCQNAEQASIEGLLSFAGRKPNALGQVAEVHWSARETDTLVETAVLRSFIAMAKKAKAGDQVVNILSRWAGFVHEFGESTSDVGDMRARRAARVHAAAPTVGVFPITSDQSWTLTRIENQHLLRLGRLALAIVSFAERTIFFQTVLNGVVADQLMGAGRAGLCSWVLGSSRQSIDVQVESGMRRLETVTALDADQLRRARLVLLNAAASPRFSKELAAARSRFVRDPHIEAFEKAWRTPSLKDLPNYLEDNAIPAHRKLDVAAKFASDTEAIFPPAFSNELLEMVDALELGARRIGRSRSLQDSSWENMEPLLARLAPEKYAAKASEFLRSIQERSPEGVLGWSFDIDRYALLVGLPELDAIRQVWERDYLKPGKASDMDSQVEAELFEVLLGSMTGIEQAQQLTLRGDERRQYVKFERLFDGKLGKQEQRELAAMATSDFAMTCVLWLASQQTRPVADIWLPVIDRALAGTDALARGMALQTLWSFDAATQRSRIDLLGKPDPKSARIEHFWTTLLLLERSQKRPNQVLDSCDLASVAAYLGHISGTRRAELAADFAARVLIWLNKQLSPAANEAPSIPVALHAPDSGTKHWPTVGVDWGLLDNSVTFRSELSVWGGIAAGEGTSPTDAFKGDKNDELQRALVEALEHSQAVDDWGYAAAWSDGTIEALLGVPKFADKLEPLIQRALGQRRVRPVASFLSSLARVLLRKGDTRGFEFVAHVEGDQPVRQVDAGNVDSLEVALFAFPESDKAHDHWLRRLEVATSDAQLLACCELLVQGKNQEWLRKQAEQDLGKDSPYYKRRGLLLLAGSGADVSAIRAWGQRISAQECALEDVLATALEYAHRLENMQHWLKAMKTAGDEITQTCAAHLLIHCSDQRIWNLLHQYKVFQRESAWSRLLEANRLRNAIKDVLKERDKRLYGFRKYELDAHPWIKSEEGFSVTMRI